MTDNPTCPATALDPLVIDLVFPLSLPLSSNDHDDRAQVRRQAAFAGIRQALHGAGLQRSRRIAMRSEASGVPRALAQDLWLQDLLGCKFPDEATALAFCGQAANMDAAPAGRMTWLLRPIHLHLGLDHLVLAAAEAGSFTLEKPEAWVERLSEALEPGWALKSWSGPRNETFLCLETPEGIDWQPRSSLQATGRSIELYLPQGADARLWRRFLNHAQMLLHEHPLNEVRIASGLPAVNGLWLEGRVTRADALSLKRLSLSEEGGPLPLPPDNGKRQILTFDDWINPVQHGDEQAWDALWRAFPARATSLRQSFDKHPIVNWHFFGEASQLSLQSAPGDSFKFWRRPMPSAL